MIERVFATIDRLNEEQRAAATFEGDQLRILAGAGTGKTTALTARVAWLVASGMPAERVMALSFTRRAAREMMHRCDTLLADAPERSRPRRRGRIVGGTFHSVAHRTLRRHAVALGLPEGFSMLDAGDAADVIDLVRDEHGAAAAGRRFPKKGTLLDVYSRTVNTQRPLSTVVDEIAPWCADQVEACCRDLPRLRATQARARSRRLRRSPALLARRGHGRPSRPDARVRDRPHLRRRISGRQRVAGRGPACAPARRSPPDRGR